MSKSVNGSTSPGLRCQPMSRHLDAVYSQCTLMLARSGKSFRQSVYFCSWGLPESGVQPWEHDLQRLCEVWGFASWTVVHQCFHSLPSEKGKVIACGWRSFPYFLSLCSRRLSPSQDARLLHSSLWASEERHGLCSTWILLLSRWFFFFFVKGKHNFSLGQYLIWDPANLNHKHLEWKL